MNELNYIPKLQQMVLDLTFVDNEINEMYLF